ncbi:MAG: hypothetical protein WA958_09680 [Tunicatimonas sp.]
MTAYEESQKVYWDNHAVMESAVETGKEIGEKIGKEEERLTIARAMKEKNLSADIIAETTGLTPK